jgi:hypothetical protein
MDIVCTWPAFSFYILEKLIVLLIRRLLVRHDHAMCRLRTEVSSIMGDSQHATREQIKKMTYLSYVIKESRYACFDLIHGVDDSQVYGSTLPSR